MSKSLKDLRKLVAENKISLVFELLIDLCDQEDELYNQIIALSAKFKDLSTKENLYLLSANEATIFHAQINYSLLNLINNFERSDSFLRISKDNNLLKRVFVSYNHKDVDIALAVKNKLKDNGIATIIDSDNFRVSEDIKLFIENSVRTSDATISIISKKSLLSAWVAMETINTFHHEKLDKNKKFIACYIDDNFFKRSFTDELINYIDEELVEVEKLINFRLKKNANTRDLNNDYTRLKDLRHNIDEIIRRLREYLCVDIRGSLLDQNFEKIIESIKQ